MIINFYDENQPAITVEDSRGELIRKEVNRESPKYVEIRPHGTFKKSDIRSMIPSSAVKSRYKTPALPPPVTEISEEERERKIAMIREAKQKFLDKRRERHANQ